MKKIIKLFILLSVSILFVSCAKDIVDLSGNISGIIKDYANGQLISNCNVSILPGGKSVTSSSSGTYEFSELTPGTYTLTFSKVGYEDTNATVSVTAGKNSTADVLIKAKSAFALSESSYDFGDFEASKIFYFFNNSDESTSFSISNIPSWLSFSQESGTVKASENEEVIVSVNRDKVTKGEYSQNITITYSGKTSGSVNLLIKMKKVVLSAPSVSISESAENIKQNSFNVNGSITATGGSQVTNYGHCWNASGNPTINDNKTELGTANAICSFKSIIKNLNTNTTYYVRAYATNAQGTSYSKQIAVSTLDAYSDKWDGTIATSFAGGTGTDGDPYIIKTGGQLLLIKDYANCCFELANNINLDNHNWKPIQFCGKIDGRGYVISNLKIDRDEDYLGLFSHLCGSTSAYYAGSDCRAVVKNITIKGVKISAPNRDYIGAIAGKVNVAQHDVIINCKVILTSDSFIKGNNYIGGIAGAISTFSDTENCEIIDCMVESVADDFVITGNKCVGGIVGCGSCHRCRVKADLSGGTFVGGIMGEIDRNSNANIFEGNIKGTRSVGGICGGIVSNAPYSKTAVTSSKSNANITVSEKFAGGVCGYADYGYLYVIGSYAMGMIKCDSSNASNIGGIVGGQGSSTSGFIINHCYSTVTSNSTILLSVFKQLPFLS